MENVKQKEKTIKSKLGRILFRRDLRALKLCQKDAVVLNRENLGLLAPLKGEIVEIITGGRGRVSWKELKGIVISKEKIQKILPLTMAFERLAEFNYETH